MDITFGHYCSNICIYPQLDINCLALKMARVQPITAGMISLPLFMVVCDGVILKISYWLFDDLFEPPKR